MWERHPNWLAPAPERPYGPGGNEFAPRGHPRWWKPRGARRREASRPIEDEIAEETTMTKGTQDPGTRHVRVEAPDAGAEVKADAGADVKAQVRDKLEVVKNTVQEAVSHAAEAAKEHTPPALQDKAAQAARDKRGKPIAGIVAGVAAAGVALKVVLSRRGRKGRKRAWRR